MGINLHAECIAKHAKAIAKAGRRPSPDWRTG